MRSILNLQLNALFYSDDYISQRHTNPQPKNFFYSIVNEFPKSMWSMIIATFTIGVVRLIRHPSDEVEIELMNELKTLNPEKIKLA